MILLVKLAEAGHRDLALAALKAVAPHVTASAREKGPDMLVLFHGEAHRASVAEKLRQAGKPGVAAALEKGVWFK